jgi:pyridoxal phosphate enzyme (YggS family)
LEGIAGNLEYVRERIARAADEAGRDPGEVCLIAVSKGRPIEVIEEAMRAGQRVFGENRAQELRDKQERLDAGLEWHFIGHLQRNKVNMVVGKAALIHSVDSGRLLEAVASRAGGLGITQDILLQVNVSGEESKYGMEIGETARVLDAAMEDPGVRVRGLMTIAPFAEDAESARPFFRRLRQLREELEADFSQADLGVLSMGMTQDFEVAVEEGANMVRIGTAIFAA